MASNPARGWQANKKRTCAPLVVLGLCPKRKNHPLGGWILIMAQCANIQVRLMQEFRRMSAYFHEMYAKFGSDRANRDTDSKMKKSIESKMPLPESGIQ